MKFSGNGLQVLQYFEDCELEAYPDPGTKGPPWTIGWGHTGPDVVPGLTWTRERADEVLSDVDLPPREQAVEQMVTVPMTRGQFDSLVDFAYNKGIGALRNSTLLRKFNAGDTLGAAQEFAKWDKAGGKSMHGLRRRAAAERALFEGRTGAQAIEIGKSTP